MNNFFTGKESYNINSYDSQEFLSSSQIEQNSNNIDFNKDTSGNDYNNYNGEENIRDSNFDYTYNINSYDINSHSDYNNSAQEPFIDATNNFNEFPIQTYENKILNNSIVNETNYLDNYTKNNDNQINLDKYASNNYFTEKFINSNTSNNVVYDSILPTKYLKDINENQNDYQISSFNGNEINNLENYKTEKYTINSYDNYRPNRNKYDLSNIVNIHTSSELETRLSLDNYEANNISQSDDYINQIMDELNN